jgi:carboxyl-terminal processing protease
MASDVEANVPASKGGVQPGDIFVEVKFNNLDDTPDDVAVDLRGPVGSKVGIVTERNGKTVDYISTREPIKITSVENYETKVGKIGKIGVIRIKTALNDLKKKGAQAIVFDIRSNPGGLLPGGVDTAILPVGN